jgi:choline dehydrogenase-like flavoprotein
MSAVHPVIPPGPSPQPEAGRRYDVVIVGAGLAGAIIAKQLGAAGKHVLLLESGPDFRNGERAQFMERYYTSSIKVPDAPYPHSLFAPSAQTLEPGNHQRDANGRLQLKPGSASYLEQKGPLPFCSTYERLAGGTMWHWLGTSLRMLPRDFKTHTHYGKGVDWPISYDDLEPYYRQAEHLIGVAANASEQTYHGLHFAPGYDYPMQAIPFSQTDQAVAHGIRGLHIDGQALTVTATPAGRNGQPRGDYQNGRSQCVGNGSCVPICPIQAKYDPSVTLSEALQSGNVTLLTQAVAVDVKVDPASGKVSGIEYIRYDTSGPQRRAVAQGALYVLAAHGIETPRLLLHSSFKNRDGQGVANSSGQVGKNLMDHPVLNCWGLLPNKVVPFRGPMSTAGIENLRDGAFRQRRSAFRIQIDNSGWNWPVGAPYSDLNDLVERQGLFGTALRTALHDKVTRQLTLNFMLEQEPQARNRITLSATKRDALGIPQPQIHYDLSDYDKQGFAAAHRSAALIFAKLGAVNHTNYADATGTPNYFRFQQVDFQFQGAGHIMGTLVMGRERASSVVDPALRSWDHSNLFVLGSAVFPTGSTANPSLTIAALSLRAAVTMLRDLG